MHTIRLRGPWNLDPLARFVRRTDGSFATAGGNLPPVARATMPADWSASFGGDFLGRVRYHRVFQKPTGLVDGQRVFLVVEPPRSRGVVSLGEHALGEVVHRGSAGRFDITEWLEEHNRLEVIVEHPRIGDVARDLTVPGGLVGEVRLEIEEHEDASGVDGLSAPQR